MLGDSTPLEILLAGASLIFIKVCTGIGDGLAERAKQAILSFGTDEKPKNSKKKAAKKKNVKTK